MAVTSKRNYSQFSQSDRQIIKKPINFIIPIESLLYLIRKSSNKREIVPLCFCCKNNNVLGRLLHRISEILDQEIYYCEKCKEKCDFNTRKCVITRNVKSIHLVNSAIATKYNLPTNMHIRVKKP